MPVSSYSLTKKIGEYIERMLEESEEGTISRRRKDLAELFECVPSQINYVLRSRFAPENGFLVESQRGGHGYIRVVQLTFKNCDETADHICDLIGNKISEQESKRLLANFQNREMITPRERLLIEIALRSQEDYGRAVYDISPHKREIMRAELMKKMLISLVLS